MMEFIPIKTRAFLPPKDNIYELLDTFLAELSEGDILLVTSKILAIHQGRCVKITDTLDKDALIMQEAEKHIPRARVPQEHVILTIKQNTLIPSAGIDESNANGFYVLWPVNSNEAAREIWEYARKKWRIAKLAVIITDSHTIPLRYGVLGISIGFFGLRPLKDYRGTLDIFGR